MGKVIDVSDLPAYLVEVIEEMVSTYRARRANPTGPVGEPPPPIGWLKGQWELPASFFDPLPDDLLDLFDGGRS